MKVSYTIIAASVAVVGAAWLGQASADTKSGYLFPGRVNSSGCVTSTYKNPGNPTPKVVQAIASLAGYSVSIRAAPGGSCNRRDWSHFVKVTANCGNGESVSDDDTGGANDSAYAYAACTARGGGLSDAKWELTTY